MLFGHAESEVTLSSTNRDTVDGSVEKFRRRDAIRM